MKLQNPIVWKHRSGDSIGRVGGCAEQSAHRGYYLFLIGSGKKDSNFYRISLPFFNGLRPRLADMTQNAKCFPVICTMPYHWNWFCKPGHHFLLFPMQLNRELLLTFCVWNIRCYHLHSIKFLHMILLHGKVLWNFTSAVQCKSTF